MGAGTGGVDDGIVGKFHRRLVKTDEAKRTCTCSGKPTRRRRLDAH